jgi:UDP-N-acetylmuramyl pentapeptide phosphotransferase/UDP-N-acetylglucosamine-1-phosphate transferase
MKITFRKIAKYKIWLDRSRQYIGYVQFALLFYIAIKEMNNSPFRTWMFNNWYITFPLVIFIVFFLCGLLGWVEDLLKIRKYEMENQLSINPEWQKLMNLFKEINDKLKHHEEQ